MTTKVSIVIPCYNQAKYLPETLNSVLSQTYANWECIVIDDGSSDNTRSVASEYVSRDNRIKYKYQNNQGLSAARNNGINATSGPYILPLDADDLIAPTYMEKAVEQLDSDCNCKLVYCNARKFGVVEEPIILPEYNYSDLLWRNSIFCSAFFRRIDYEKTDGYNPNMIYGFEDWDFWLSLLQPEDKVVKLSDVLFFYRIKTSSMLPNAILHKDYLFERIFLNHKNLYAPYMKDIVKIKNENQYLATEIEAIISSRAYKTAQKLSNLFWGINKLFKQRKVRRI